MSTDETMSAASSAPAPEAQSAARRCPWCSEPLPVEAAAHCPHCNAILVVEGEPHLPGLTEVEAPSVTKARRTDGPKRSKLLSWISGDVESESMPAVASPDATDKIDALAPPPLDVRREMLRIQLEAEGLTLPPDGSVEPPAASPPDEIRKAS
jgi:hypothetical protein